jgi:hypothetical protein
MALKRRDRLVEGALCGLFGGVVLLIAQTIAAQLKHSSPAAPLRLTASLLLGPSALTTRAVVPTVLVGVLLLAGLAVGYGALFGLVAGALPREDRTDAFRLPALGILWGFLVWLIGFQIIARVAFPWLLRESKFSELILHAFFYGLPMALAFLMVERHAPVPPALPHEA